MSTAMIDYDNFDLDTELAERYSLPEAVSRAKQLRGATPDSFVRIKSVEGDKFLVKQLTTQEVYGEWMARIQGRLSEMLRKRVVR